MSVKTPFLEARPSDNQRLKNNISPHGKNAVRYYFCTTVDRQLKIV